MANSYNETFRRRQLIAVVLGVVLFLPGTIWLLAPGRSEPAVSMSSTGLILITVGGLGLVRGRRKSQADVS